MNKPKVVVTRTQFENEMDRLKEVSDLIVIDSPQPPTKEELKEKISGATALFAHINDAAESGADIVTVPSKVIYDCMKNSLTVAGIERFKQDWNKLQQ